MTTFRTEADLLRWLRDNVAELLDLEPGDVDSQRPLTELGLSSRDAVGLVGDLEDLLDRDLDATLIWQTPTIAALARALSGDGTGDALNPTAAAPATFTNGHPGEDAVAIIGLGCRFPGDATGPDAFWALLDEARDAVTDVPEGRWEAFHGVDAASSAAVDRTNRTGGWLSDVAGFDADFFGISQREAELMDPQQRMLLETFIEAVDHAGLRLEDLRGSSAGVFVGMSTNEYSHLATADLANVDAWTASGSAFSIAANRISYLFDLHGPSITLDTACSSSLTAIHQAVLSMQAGEIGTAFVAGVNLTLSPAITMTFDQAGALAPAGGSKPFSSDADGIARAEGVGVVVLKKLSQAEQDGDRILAVVRGSGVNQDGRSNGLTAPNPVAQEALLRDVYARAGIDPRAVDYVEAHGTGTMLGDPIEASALGAALGAGRDADKPLLLGSVKSNLGHLESAAGMAGVIKVVLGMRHDRIPASLKYAGPNPHIRFDDWHLAVADTARPWPRYGGTALAGVSGFGFGGTNAHVVIEEYRQPVAPAVAPERDDELVVLPLSAANDERLRDRAGALAAWVAGSTVPLGQVASTLTRRRSRGPAATVIGARGRAELVRALQAYADGAQPSTMPEGTVAMPPVPRTSTFRPTDKAVWVFSGWGSQWIGMAKRLLVDEPAFAASVDELDPVVQAEAGFSLRGALEGTAEITTIAAIQIATYGIQVAMADLWRAYGAEPAAVIGHSMGEISAAAVAGAISRADGVRIMTVRSTLIEEGEQHTNGGLAAVQMDTTEFDRVVAERFPDVVISVYSSPSMLTVGSADRSQIDGLVAYAESLGRTVFPLAGRGAPHSHMIDPMLPEMRERLADVVGRTPEVPLYSTSDIDPRAVQDFGIEYWLRNVRQPVRFSQTVAALVEDGHVAFLEVSPHPISMGPVKQVASGRGVGPELLTLGTLRRDGDDGLQFRASALALHEAGLRIDVDQVVPVAAQADVADRAWRRKRFWLQADSASVPAAAVDGHPLLGVHVELPEGGRHLWRADIGTALLPWVEDHQVYNVPVLPVAAYAEMVLAAGREVLAPGQERDAVALSDLQIDALMSLGEHTDVTTSLTVLAPGEARVDIHARPPGMSSSSPMVKNATAMVRRAVADDATPATDLVDLTALENGRHVDLYAVMQAGGHEYGPAFIGVTDARLADDGLAVARATLAETVATNRHFGVHPVLLDICLQTLVVSGLGLLEEDADVNDQGAFLPVGVGRVQVHADPGNGGLVTARLRRDGDDLKGSLRVVGDDGTLLLEVHDVMLRRIDSAEIAVPLPDLLLEAAWERDDLDSPKGRKPVAQDWVLVDAADDPGVAALLAEASRPITGAATVSAGRVAEVMEQLGQRVTRLRPDEIPPDQRPDGGVVVMLPGLVPDAVAVGGELAIRIGTGLVDLILDLLARMDDGPQDAAPVRVALVGSDAFDVLDGEIGRPALASVRGVVRSRALGKHRTAVSLIDSDDVPDVVRELLTRAGAPDKAWDDEVAYRGGDRRVRRLRRVPMSELSQPFRLRPGGYVVMEGMSPAGLRLAGELVGRLAGAGRSRVMLVGPTVADPDQAAAIAALSGAGVEVETAIAEATDFDRLKGVVAAATAGELPLRGLIQAPGERLGDAEQAARAAWMLHEVSTGYHRQLDLWLLRSTASALTGDPADPVDAGIGAWLDGLVRWRRAQGLPGTAVQWGELAPDQVAAAFGLLGPDRAVLGVEHLSGTRLAQVGAVPYFKALTAIEGEEDAGDWVGPERLRAMAPAAARQTLADRLRIRVAMVMGRRPEEVDVTIPLSSLGVDSLMAMRAKNAVEQDVGVQMPVRLLLQGASLADLEEYLAGELGIQAGAAPKVYELVKGEVEPRDGTERWVTAVWDTVTGRLPTNVCAPITSFGDADAAGRVADTMLERLEVQPGVAARRAEWPTREQLIGAETIEIQADLVRDLIEHGGDSPTRLLAPGEIGRLPLFVFHPAGGTTSVYFPLVGQMEKAVPVYGFDRLDGLTDLDDKVTEYMRLMREVQPSGPYRLGGWSFGGALAYRTAQRLREEGEEVSTLFMIDTILAREDDQTEDELLAGRFQRWIEYIESTYELKLDIDVQALVQLEEQDQINTLMQMVIDSGANLSDALIEHQRTSYEDARLAEKYTPSAYGAGHVVLYRSSERGLTNTIDPRYARTEESLGWDVYCSDLEVVSVPGNHTSMIDRPAVDTMATHLTGALARDEQAVPHA